MPQMPVFFHISPDHCGAQRIARLFQLNGYRFCNDDTGQLAEDIAWAQATGETPLRKWSGTRFFAGLYRHRPWWKRPLESWRSFAFLRQHFPEARFILTTRNLDDWLLDRMTAAKGDLAKTYAAHYRVTEAELTEIWAGDWQAHLDTVDSVFGDDPALIRVDCDTETLDDLRHRLDAVLPMKHPPQNSGWQFHNAPSLEAMLSRMLEPAQATPQQQAEEFVEDVADFCLKGRCDPGTRTDANLSPLYLEWDGNERVLDKGGAPHPTTITDLPGYEDGFAISAPGQDFKQRRGEDVINDILSLGRRDPVNIDMEDARWIGVSRQGIPLQPVLCHNRRTNARNVILWPLPEMMGPGHVGYVYPCPDQIAYEEKQDRLVWRGMVTGNERTDRNRPGRSALRYLREMATEDTAAREEAWQGLCRTNRMAVVRRFFAHPRCDIRIAMAWNYRQYAKDPRLAPYCSKREGPGFFHGSRYQLCMTGFDHGSNFMSVINSQSVLLKEDDGWEVYFSGRFKPWKHFIPLERYCDDLDEKLEWARENPNECKEMSRLARVEAAMFSDPVLTRAIKHRILDGLAEKS